MGVERNHLGSSAQRVPAPGQRLTGVGSHPRPRLPRRLRVLSQDEAEALGALTGRLIPGGDELRVIAHIDAELDRAGNERAVAATTFEEMYRHGLRQLQRHAETRFGRPVQALSDEERDLVLWDLLDGAMDGFDAFTPLEFFRTLRRHTADGMVRDSA